MRSEPPEELEELIDDQPASLAETRAAEKLEIDPQELKWWAMNLYIQSLEQESLERGGATRAIIEEIRSEIGNDA